MFFSAPKKTKDNAKKSGENEKVIRLQLFAPIGHKEAKIDLLTPSPEVPLAPHKVGVFYPKSFSLRYAAFAGMYDSDIYNHQLFLFLRGRGRRGRGSKQKMKMDDCRLYVLLSLHAAKMHIFAILSVV